MARGWRHGRVGHRNYAASIDEKSVPVMTCLASDVDSGWFLVVKPPRGSEILAFGPFVTPSAVKTARSNSDIMSLRENRLGFFGLWFVGEGVILYFVEEGGVL